MKEPRNEREAAFTLHQQTATQARDRRAVIRTLQPPRPWFIRLRRFILGA